jgi:2,3-bisphosphoglycerate-dependent phosphoglycerate mutase
MTQPVRLVLLRHAQSERNAAGIFTGWENAPLTVHGEAEAARAGSMLVEHGVLPAFVHTSLQHRTIRTADLALAAADRDWDLRPDDLGGHYLDPHVTVSGRLS